MHFSFARAAACVVVLITINACSPDSAFSPDRAAAVSEARIASAPAPDRATSKYEIDFMEGMIDHHAMAVQMGEMCLAKDLVHEELRELCANIVATQTEEIQKMQTWLRDWYGITYEPQMKPGMMNQMEKLAALDGAEFEIEFMQMMIKHHRKAVKEGEQCLKKAYHPELRELCGDIVEAQTSEIELMQTWLCQWYDICKDTP
jgi:uncharacterized protein (DUF305 family)